MRRSRTLTQTERWELGLLLGLLFTACLCLTVLFKHYALPKLFAVAPVAPAPAQPATLEPTPINTVASPSENTTARTVAPDPYTVEEPAVVEVAPENPKGKPDIKYYNGKKFQYARTLRLRVTAYAPDPRCCYPYDGTTTASGLSVKTNGGKLVAADTRLIPMHSLVSVPGYASGSAVPVLDRGGAIKGHRLDVLLPTYDTAKKWGSRYLDVKVYEPVK